MKRLPGLHHRLVFLSLLSTLLLACTAPTLAPYQGANTSQLWGKSGELFKESGPLSDWSYAGYRAGEVPIPRKAPSINVQTQHGAIPNDGQDDSAALLAALKSAKAGDVVHIPAGTYVLKQMLNIPSGVVLQGAGSQHTIIDIPVSLLDISTQDPSFVGGFIRAVGSSTSGKKISAITASAQRGERYLKLQSTQGIQVGQWVHIVQTDREGDLLVDALYLNNTKGAGDYKDLLNRQMMDFYSRVSAVNADGITLERALPIAVKPQYRAEVHSVKFALEEIGIEGLTIRFPLTRYPGHFNERGYNAIDMTASNSWIRDVRVINVDYGINLRGAHFVTVEDFTLINEQGRSGHHGISIGRGGDNLVRRFDFQASLIHDLTVEWFTFGNVFTQGRGDNLSMDHHKAAPYGNLFTELHMGDGSQTWVTGGSKDRGYRTAAYATVWNLRGDKPLPWPQSNYGPNMVLIGVDGNRGYEAGINWWREAIPAAMLEPKNLWLAQRQRRLGYE